MAINLLLFSFACLQLACVNGQGSVSLTVEGGGNDLVGPHCPGTVRLVCEGVRLGVLQWRYVQVNVTSGPVDIGSFFDSMSDAPTTISPGHPAFVSLTLDDVIQDPSDDQFGNFTSTLTVDLGQLQNVTYIICGDTRTASVPVNVTILQPTIPATPNITTITANYQSTELSSLEVTWAKLETLCPQFEASLRYEISVGSGTSQNIHQSSCEGSSCTVHLNTSSTGEAALDLLLRAINELGISGTATYLIEQDRGQYFTPEVNISENCDATLRCIPGGGVNESAMCSVGYMDLSDPVMSPLSMTFPLQKLQPNTVYFFVFSVMVDERLTVNITLESSSGACDAMRTEPGIIIAAVLVPVLIILVILAVVIVAVFLFKRIYVTRRNKNNTESQTDSKNGLVLTQFNQQPVDEQPPVDIEQSPRQQVDDEQPQQEQPVDDALVDADSQIKLGQKAILMEEPTTPPNTQRYEGGTSPDEYTDMAVVTQTKQDKPSLPGYLTEEVPATQESSALKQGPMVPTWIQERFPSNKDPLEHGVFETQDIPPDHDTELIEELEADSNSPTQIQQASHGHIGTGGQEMVAGRLPLVSPGNWRIMVPHLVSSDNIMRSSSAGNKYGTEETKQNSQGVRVVPNQPGYRDLEHLQNNGKPFKEDFVRKEEFEEKIQDLNDKNNEEKMQDLNDKVEGLVYKSLKRKNELEKKIEELEKELADCRRERDKFKTRAETAEARPRAIEHKQLNDDVERDGPRKISKPKQGQVQSSLEQLVAEKDRKISELEQEIKNLKDELKLYRNKEPNVITGETGEL